MSTIPRRTFMKSSIGAAVGAVTAAHAKPAGANEKVVLGDRPGVAHWQHAIFTFIVPA